MKRYDLIQTHSGSQTRDGVMRESEDGEWVSFEDAIASVFESFQLRDPAGFKFTSDPGSRFLYYGDKFVAKFSSEHARAFLAVLVANEIMREEIEGFTKHVGATTFQEAVDVLIRTKGQDEDMIEKMFVQVKGQSSEPETLRTDLATKDAQIAELLAGVDRSRRVARINYDDILAERNAIKTECEGLNRELSSAIAFGDAATARAESAEKGRSEDADVIASLLSSRDAALALVETCRKALTEAQGALDVLSTFHRHSPTWRTCGIETTRKEIAEALAALPVAGTEGKPSWTPQQTWIGGEGGDV